RSAETVAGSPSSLLATKARSSGGVSGNVVMPSASGTLMSCQPSGAVAQVGSSMCSAPPTAPKQTSSLPALDRRLERGKPLPPECLEIGRVGAIADALVQHGELRPAVAGGSELEHHPARAVRPPVAGHAGW